MSDYIEQEHVYHKFLTSEPWIILTPIELEIKKKIEKVGKSLKDWNIKINYGIKTGFNDAFIITTDKRNEILNRCTTEEERKKTEEIIRPILRGRDIKKYTYEWGEQWLIATFPSRHYDINRYPAIKNYLLTFAKDMLLNSGNVSIANSHLSDFCMQKLSQTGKFIEIEGKRIITGGKPERARKKTSNKWFETQDSISYWEDFSLPKIIWKRIGSILRFSYDINKTIGLDSTCFLTGTNIEFICCVLNSPMGHYLMKDSPKTGTGDLLVSVQAVEPLKLPEVSDVTNEYFKNVLSRLILKQNCKDVENEISCKVFDLYNLSQIERDYIIKNFT